MPERDVTKESILKTYFGYGGFREGQAETIDALLAGRDALAVMPTGAGKSICYQIPALMSDGLAVVISPLISLMKDQVQALSSWGIKAAFLNSSLTPDEYRETLDEIYRGNYSLLYLAPERLNNGDILALVQALKVSFVIIDEAHCVSQWGHDFRPGYLAIRSFIEALPVRPAVGAFTATATIRVRQDILNLTGLKNPFVRITGFDRANLFFAVLRPQNKLKALLAILEKRKGRSAIVYCATRKTVEEVCRELLMRGYSASRYHAGLPDDERKRNQDDFINDRVSIMVATCAFGMGIDKSNVALVLHYNMPKNIESYYQEAGRAGRDGENAECILLYAPSDVHTNKRLIIHDKDEDEEQVKHNLELLKYMTFYATAKTCLRAFILKYFGEKPPPRCGNCSVCVSAEDAEENSRGDFRRGQSFDAAKKISVENNDDENNIDGRNQGDAEDITIDAQKIVSCVIRLEQRSRPLGKALVVRILRGSRDKRIMQGGFDTLSTYGIMADSSRERLNQIADFLIDEGYLQLVGDEYPLLRTTKKSAEIVFQKKPLSFVFESEKSRRRELDALSRDDGVEAWPGQAALFDRLKALRLRLAREEAVPAYIVFSDAALRAISIRRPRTPAEFLDTPGVGSSKLQKYGSAFLAAVREFDGVDGK